MRFARHYGPDDGSHKKRAALRGGGVGAGACWSLASLLRPCAPSCGAAGFGFRGIPFADGMRDYGCGKTSDQQYIIRNTRRSMQRNTKQAPGR